METEYITLKELATELGIDRSNLRKYVLQNCFPTIKVRTKSTRGQQTLALSLENAEAVRNLRNNEGFVKNGLSPIVDDTWGYFYIIQPLPNLAPCQVKLGFSTNVDQRLRSYKTIVPDAILTTAWNCKKVWETVAIDSITREECKALSSEVYDCEDLVMLLQRADSFFAIMPVIEF